MNLAYRIWMQGARKRLLDVNGRAAIIVSRDAPATQVNARGLLEYALAETQAEYDALQGES